VGRGEHRIEQRFTLEVERVSTDGSVENCKTVINDVVVHKPESSRVIRVRVSVDDEEVGQYTADGMIVATAAGSTAYSLSAGGPVVLPHVDAMVITPICPHTLRVRPVVVPGTAKVVLESIPRGAEEPLVQLDGQHACSLKRGESVVVRRAPLSVHLVRVGREGFFARMRQKLEWGDLSDRERMTRAD
jgi:NAD+ kinase